MMINDNEMITNYLLIVLQSGNNDNHDYCDDDKHN